jgi:hypothetical protein
MVIFVLSIATGAYAHIHLLARIETLANICMRREEKDDTEKE